ncbi:DUF4254 domain-containing protein [candidate division KSB1 bacterium]|nr:DUF4254 domain-containing protein [candidate division KSB1 bacterium]
MTCVNELLTIKTNNYADYFDQLNQNWHAKFDAEVLTHDTFEAKLWNLHFYNYSLWHEEDEARRTDVTDSLIAQNKRNIDKFNQKRNDSIELIDKYLLVQLAQCPNYQEGLRMNSETAGSMLDRLSIISLKIYHMAEQMQRPEATEAHRAACATKHARLLEQRADLMQCFALLIDDYLAGRKSLKVYFQFKMYNDPNLNPALYGKNSVK